MPLSMFAQYAAIASLFIITVTIIILTVKARIDRRTITYTIVTTKAMTDQMLDDMLEKSDFDEHVASTPGMKPFMHTLN